MTKKLILLSAAVLGLGVTAAVQVPLMAPRPAQAQTSGTTLGPSGTGAGGTTGTPGTPGTLAPVRGGATGSVMSPDASQPTAPSPTGVPPTPGASPDAGASSSTIWPMHDVSNSGSSGTTIPRADTTNGP